MNLFRRKRKKKYPPTRGTRRARKFRRDRNRRPVELNCHLCDPEGVFREIHDTRWFGTVKREEASLSKLKESNDD